MSSTPSLSRDTTADQVAISPWSHAPAAAPAVAFVAGAAGLPIGDLRFEFTYDEADQGSISPAPGVVLHAVGVCDEGESPTPLLCAHEEGAIAFCGTLYNEDELREQARRLGLAAAEGRIAELVLLLYLRDREWFLREANGKFVAAIHRPGRLTLLRDKLGEEQLYYGVRPEGVVFASAARVVARAFGGTELVAPPSVRIFETPIGSETMLAGVRKLEPATELTIDLASGREDAYRYWEPRPTYPLLSDGEYVEAFRSLLRDSIRRRVPKNGRFGGFLSGGQDSSFVTCTLRDLGSPPAHVYTTAWADLDSVYNELRWARLVADHTAAEHVVLEPTPDDFSTHYGVTMAIFDETKANAAHFTEYWIARAARERGERALFSGYGSDEALGGEIRYLVMYLDRDRAAAAPLFTTSELLRNYKPLADKLAEVPAGTPEPDKYFHLMKRGDAGKAVVEGLRQTIRDLFARWHTLIDRVGWVDMSISGQPLIDTAKVDKFWGVDKICPFLDHRVVELAFRLPEELKIRGLVTKRILRLASAGLVPEQITQRPDKVGFAFPHNDPRYLMYLTDLAAALERRKCIKAAVDHTRDRFDRGLLMAASEELVHRALDRGVTPRELL